MCAPNGPLFPALPGIWLATFFKQKVYESSDFSGFLCERPPFSDILVYAHIFCSEIFRGCLFSWYLKNWLRYLSNYQQWRYLLSFDVNTINIVIECNENISIFTSAMHVWKFECFHYTRWKFYGIHWKRVNFLFIILLTRQCAFLTS